VNLRRLVELKGWITQRLLGLSQASSAILGLCAVAVLWGGIIHSLSVEREQALQGAAQDTSNLSRAFEEHIVRSIKAVDQTLLYVREAYEKDPTGFDISAWAKNVQFLTDLTFQISLIDKNGILRGSNLSANGERINLSDRAHYSVQRDSALDELFISKPILGRVSQKWSIQMTRKMIGADGTFDGVVVVSLDPQYLSKFYDSVEVGTKGVVSLTGTDGIVRARAAAGNTNVGQSMIGTRLLEEFARSPSGNFEATSTIDGTRRVYAYRGVRSYPLVVSVGLARSEVLAATRQNRRLYIALGSVLTAILLGATAMIMRRDSGLRDAREKLRASEARFAQKSNMLEATLENMSQGIMMVDADRRVQVCNHRAIEKLGLPAELMARHPMLDEVLRWQWQQGEFGQDGGDVEEWLRRFVLAGGISDEPQRYERTRPNGRTLEFRSVPLADGGVVRTYTDITMRKQTEQVLRAARDEADRAARQKAEFLAMMSHEIRSPMSSLLGIIELLQNTKLEADQSYMVELAQDSATTLLGIVNDVLDLSKIDAGAVAPALEPTALHELIRGLMRPIALAAARKDLSLRYELDETVPDWISVDPLRLRQILDNLLGNAVKFTRAGGAVDLTVAHPSGQDILTFSVRDTGIGMGTEVLERLFQPFSQADASTTKNFGGTGLGLSISRRLARLAGGDIVVSSEPESGSIFTLTIPLVAAEQPENGGSGAPTELTDRTLRDVRVLVAEDQETNRWVIQRQFSRLGVEVELVEDGHHALAALAEGGFGLLVTDCHMPGMDGVELTKRIRAAEAEFGIDRLPILGLTADVTQEMRRQCLDAGMDEVASKPINLPRLEAALRQLMRGDSLRDPVVAADSAGERLFDDSTYLDLFGENSPIGSAWLNGYLTATVGGIERVRHAIEAGDRKTLRSEVHTIAGASLTAGAMRVGRLAAELELPSATASLDQLRRLVEALESGFRETYHEIQGFIAAKTIAVE
jgi:signal transduction histidine kinase/FixJ family two-component response regulator/HPt (histidine-containing phosphotransfer) domain-containing protein